MTLYSVRWLGKNTNREHIITTDAYATVRTLVDMLKLEGTPSEIMNMSDHTVSFQHVLTEGQTVIYNGTGVTVKGTIPGIDLVYLSNPDGGDKLDIMVRHHTITW